MIAYDLPYHGKSLPPLLDRWWEQPYKPSGKYLMHRVVAIADALSLEQPISWDVRSAGSWRSILPRCTAAVSRLLYR
jgi:hypothetical protein